MPRQPSARMLPNSVDLYIATPGRGRDGEPLYTYGSSPTYRGVRCSVQIRSYNAGVDEVDRMTEAHEYRIYFIQAPLLKPEDKIVWIDNSGVRRTLFANAVADQAGRGVVWSVLAEERV